MSHVTEIQSNNADLQSILSKVNGLPDALDTSDATASAGDIASGKTAYVNGEKVTGLLEKVELVEGSFTGASSWSKTITVDGLKGANNFIMFVTKPVSSNVGFATSDYQPLIGVAYINGKVVYASSSNSNRYLADCQLSFDKSTGKITISTQYMYIGYACVYRYWKW